MDKLFDTKDILTVATADQAVVGTNGYFCDGLHSLAIKIRQSDIGTLTSVNANETYCFKSNNGASYMFFLPAGKVKNKEPVYRPLRSIDELFNFLVVPSFTADNYNTFDKVDIIFSSVFELKGKNSGCIYYKKFTSIRVTDYGIVLDAFTLDHYFENYEIKQNGEFVPFGIKEE